jgi:predicted alpha/beta-fold hydrolase
LTWSYRAPWWLPGGNLQTIYAAKGLRSLGDKSPIWKRQRWETPDKDFIDVDWLAASTSQWGAEKNADHNCDETPLLVLFHGLEGSSASHYAIAFANEAQRIGWQMAVPHFRGCSGEINRTPRAYHSGDYQEIDWMLRRFQSVHQGPVVAVGISLGGNALMKWACEVKAEANKIVTAVASVCAPLDLTASGHAIDSGFNRIAYAKMFLGSMKPRAFTKLAQFPNLFDAQAMQSVTTLFAFDDIFTAPLHGFKNATDYWLRASAKPGLCDIQLPAWVINTKNDPFVPACCLPKADEVAPCVELCQPADGGHVGFTSGAFPGTLHALPQAVLRWFDSKI